MCGISEIGADDVMCCPGIYQYLRRLSIDCPLHSQQVVLPYQLYCMSSASSVGPVTVVPSSFSVSLLLAAMASLADSSSVSHRLDDVSEMVRIAAVSLPVRSADHSTGSCRFPADCGAVGHSLFCWSVALVRRKR